MEPYSILGVSPSATDEEIKHAYRELARKYHPDNYHDNPLSDLANEKMKQINKAYDDIQEMRSKGKNNSGNGYAYSYSGETDSELGRIRMLISEGRYSEADIALDSVPQTRRGAEWNYLKGVLLAQRNWFFDAAKYFETACRMDPNNMEYREALNAMRTQANSGPYRTSQGAAGNNCSYCDICSSLICADCLCECCGGDLIRCC